MEHPNVAEKNNQAGCACPFCDNAMEMPFPFCQVCGSRIVCCEVCGEVLPQDADSCLHCAEKR